MLKRIKDIRENQTHLKMGIAFAVLLSLLAGVVVFSYVFPGTQERFSAFLYRARNTVSFVVFGQKPHFYFLEGEKNGKEFYLAEKSFFEISYRDEFVIKSVSTDAVFSDKIKIDVQGLGKEDDFRMLLKGIELVDKVALSETDLQYHIIIRYDKEIIASIPIRVEVTAQDWLRYAKGTNSNRERIEYLKKAIALNNKDVSVRKMLSAAYQKAGIKEDKASPEKNAVAQTKEKQTVTVKADVPKKKQESEPDGSAPEKIKKAHAEKEITAGTVERYVKEKKYDLAIKSCTQLIKKKPKDAKNYTSLGNIYGLKGDAGRQISAYKKSLQLRGNNGPLYIKLGEVYEKKGKNKEAMQAYKKAYDLNPNEDRAARKITQLKIRMLKEKYKDEG